MGFTLSLLLVTIFPGGTRDLCCTIILTQHSSFTKLHLDVSLDSPLASGNNQLFGSIKGNIEVKYYFRNGNICNFGVYMNRCIYENLYDSLHR